MSVNAVQLSGAALPPFFSCADPFLAFETDSYSVFFKPPGMHSVPASSSDSPGDSGDSLLSWVRVSYPALESAYNSLGPLGSVIRGANQAGAGMMRSDLASLRAWSELGMLSRLDKETSGLVAFARRPEIFFHALEGQASGQSRKLYWLLAVQAFHEEGLEGSRPRCFPRSDGDPVLAGLEFKVESYFRSYGPRGKRVACIAPDYEGGKHKKISVIMYRTMFRPIQGAERRQSGDWPAVPRCLAWEASLNAGFRHQIRAHMAWCGHPIAGDQLYGRSNDASNAGPCDSSEVRADFVSLETQPCPEISTQPMKAVHERSESAARLYLECHRLELTNPIGNTEIFELTQE
jgi:23S rRNA-/tRNA-specific pseudouridylate synthase